MRRYFKVYGPSNQLFLAEFPQDGARVEYELLMPHKAAAISAFNGLSAYGYGRDQTQLVWYLWDITTGTPPGGGEQVAAFSAIVMANGTFEVHPYHQHPKN